MYPSLVVITILAIILPFASCDPMQHAADIKQPSSLGDQCENSSQCFSVDPESGCLANLCQCLKWRLPSQKACSSTPWAVIFFGIALLSVLLLVVVPSVIYVCVIRRKQPQQDELSLRTGSHDAASQAANQVSSGVELQDMFTNGTHQIQVDASAGESVPIRLGALV